MLVRFLCSLLLLAIFLTGSSTPGEAAPIDGVEATVSSELAIPPLVKKRMEESVRIIGEQLLLGHHTETTDPDKISSVIHEVFDKVLVGYSVEHVDTRLGTDTQVVVRLIPWDEVVRSVQVETTVEGMPPGVEALVREDASGIDAVFREGLIGLPVAATDWTNGVLKKSLNAYMEKKLPEFRADFDVDTDEVARVRVTLYPRLPIVRTTDLSMRSDTVPNFTLLGHRDLLQREVDSLVGVPVAFVLRHRETFERQFAASLDDAPDFRALGMKTAVTLAPAERMEVMSRSDSERLRLRLTGWLDIGRSEGAHHKRKEDLLFQLHGGWMLTSRDELFYVAYLYPQDMNWRTELGYGRSLGTAVRAEARYDFESHGLDGALFYRLAPRWILRYEYQYYNHEHEAALRYDLHDFLGLEYVQGQEGGWLRLIGNF